MGCEEGGECGVRREGSGERQRSEDLYGTVGPPVLVLTPLVV